MSDIKIATVGVLHQIWKEKNWIFPTPDDSSMAFDKLCQMTAILNKDEQALLVNLTRYYSHYSFTEYQGLLIEAISKIGEEHLTNVDQILIAPLVSPADAENNRSKSGHSLLYVAQYVAIPANKELAKFKLVAIANPVIDRGTIDAKKLLVILIDDFVGSGDTAEKAIAHVKGSLSANDEIVVVCLVAMQKGIDRLAGSLIPFYWAKLVPSGIESNPFITDKNYAYELVDKIWEKYLKVSPKYKRGHKESEALVSLVRTPNNTLPMYWCKRSRDGTDWPSPFSR